MAESTQERVLQALRTRFAAITSDGGSTRWYTVDYAVRFPAFTAECLNTPGDVVYVLSPDETPLEAGTYTQTLARMTFDLSLAKRFAPTTEDPFSPPTEDRLLLQNRLIQDATAALYSDATLGGLATWTWVRFENRRAEDTYLTGEPWAVAFLRLEVEAYYSDATP